jgi:hypothetical protein
MDEPPEVKDMFTIRVLTREMLGPIPIGEVYEACCAEDVGTAVGQAILTADRNALMHCHRVTQQVNRFSLEFELSEPVAGPVLRQAWLDALTEINSTVSIRPESVHQIPVPENDGPSQSRPDKTAGNTAAPGRGRAARKRSRKEVANG